MQERIDPLLSKVKTYIIGSMTTAKPMSFAEFNAKQKEEADERHRPMIEAYRKGLSQVEVAEQFGVTRARVQQVLRRARERGML